MNILSTPIPMLDRVFLVAAAAGGTMVLLRAIMLFAGGDLDGHDWDAGDGGGHGETEDGFRFLSVFGLAAFFMMFGLVGMALRHPGKGMGGSIVGGLLAGLATLWILARLFRLGQRLQSSGTIHPQAAVGCQGTVYMTIPAGGTGRVTIRVRQRVREMDAIHSAGTELPTGTQVRVVRVDQTLAVVEPLSSED